MGLNLQFGRCPLFPPAFHIRSPEDLFRPLPVDGPTLFFQQNISKTGHYTLMWSMAKVMSKIAKGTVSIGDRVDVWKEFLAGRLASEMLMARMMERYIGVGWDTWVI